MIRAFRSRSWMLLSALGLLLPAGRARAIPSFAQQTGEACTACHVGAYGPQLTPLGRPQQLLEPHPLAEPVACHTPRVRHRQHGTHRMSDLH